MHVLLSLGSNIGDREENLRNALRLLALQKAIRLVAISHSYETEPWGNLNQPGFLNAAAEICTELAPMELLNAVKAIESQMGRQPGTRWGPRIIDIDLILWGALTLDEKSLILPHPSFRERAFVLTPLAEIAGGAVDPITGLTVAALAARPEAQGTVRKLGLISP
jgi:2-amino-4-hydroxy-6-hydroxymethyldihydropteridine diphosphokinase